MASRLGLVGFGTVCHFGPKAGKDRRGKSNASGTRGDDSPSDGSLVVSPASSCGKLPEPLCLRDFPMAQRIRAVYKVGKFLRPFFVGREGPFTFLISQIRSGIPACEQLGHHPWASADGQPAAPNLVRQIGKNGANLTRKGTVAPFGAQRVRANLLANPPPRPVLGVKARADRQRAVRLVWENGDVEGLAKKVKIKSWVAEVREGRRNRQGSQWSGGFAEQCGPIRFRAIGAAHSHYLAQAFPLCLPRFVTHAERIQKIPPIC